MVTHYRWDFIGLSTDSKPTPATSEKVADGSTYYESDTSKLYVWYDDQWYEKTAGGGGEGGDGIVELTTSDYDWPVSTPDGVALWKLDTGIYKASAGTKLYVNSNDKFTLGEGVSVLYDVSIISDTARIFSTYLGRSGTSNVNRPAIAYTKISDGSRAQIADISYLYGRSNEILMARDIYDALTQSNPQQVAVLSAYQGYLLDQKISGLSVYRDPDTKEQIQVGNGSSAPGTTATAVGAFSTAQSYAAVSIGNTAGDQNNNASHSISIGAYAHANAAGSVALGAYSKATVTGTVDISTSNSNYGYGASKFRKITGMSNGEDAHDGATVAQGNLLVGSAPTTSTVGVLGQLYTDTSSMHTYQCTAISGNTYTWTQRW